MKQYNIPISFGLGSDRMNHLYIHEFDIKRLEKTKQGAGNFKTTEVMLYEKAIGRVTTSSAGDRELYEHDKQKFVVSHKIYMPSTYELQETDRIYFKDEVLEVLDKPRNPSYLDHHLEVFCKRVT